MTDEAKINPYPDPSAKAREIAKLKKQNDDTIERIARMGVELNFDDIARKRDTELFGWIWTNLLTEAQREDFNLIWQQHLAQALKKTEGQARELVAAQQRGHKSGIVTPGASGLIIPGHVRRPGS